MILRKDHNNWDPDKAHGHDKVSIRMKNIFGKPICKLLQLIFSQCIDTGSFSIEWKKANVVQVHKKGDNNVWEITDQSHCFQIAEKYLKD